MHQSTDAVHQCAQLRQSAELFLAQHSRTLEPFGCAGELPATIVIVSLPDTYSSVREAIFVPFQRTGVNMQKIVIVANGAAYGSESL